MSVDEATMCGPCRAGRHVECPGSKYCQCPSPRHRARVRAEPEIEIKIVREDAPPTRQDRKTQTTELIEAIRASPISKQAGDEYRVATFSNPKRASVVAATLRKSLGKRWLVKARATDKGSAIWVTYLAET